MILEISGQKIGFFGTTGATKPTVTGVKGSTKSTYNSILSALYSLGLITNTTTSGISLYQDSGVNPSSNTYNAGDILLNNISIAGSALGWVCAISGCVTKTAVEWQASTAYAVNDTITSGTTVYICSVAGTSGTTTLLELLIKHMVQYHGHG
jgi:hypothetical protein